jgi:hypothetical protein
MISAKSVYSNIDQKPPSRHTMKRVCPNPIPWAEAFESLAAYARSHACTPPAPPRPLILAGWVGSNDQDKMLRWEDTITWAYTNGCGQIIEGIAEQDFYFVDNPTTYVVGPMADRCIGRGLLIPSLALRRQLSIAILRSCRPNGWRSLARSLG